TLAVLINALALVQRARQITHEPNGIDGSNIVAIHVVPFDAAFNDKNFVQAQLKSDLAFLRNYPGVVDASVTNSFPGDVGSNSSMSVAGAPENSGVDVGVFTADDHMLSTLGVDLVAGRNFAPGDIFFSNWPPSDKTLPKEILITRVAAKRLFADKDPLGQSVSINGTTRTVIGIVGAYRGRNPLLGNAASNVFLPGYLTGASSSERLLVRVKPGTVSAMMQPLADGLLNLNNGRDIDTERPLSELLSRGNAMYAYGGLVLLSISGLLIFTTGLGIFGVAYFSVTKRRRQIGTRRALGASKANVLQYFLLENLLITGTGVIVGSALAIALNIQLTNLGLGRTDWAVTGLGIVFVIAISQLSVLVPAWKASQIDPAIATRT
ncbi:MAG TPA: FtsX-like permease family protein, partial [Pseudomonadales bacterium]|nr:FtsX-like permease family protein [Pseudomonadales bacterium]